MSEPGKVSGFTPSEEPKKTDSSTKPSGETKGFEVPKGPMNNLQKLMISKAGSVEEGLKLYNKFMTSFMIASINQMNHSSQQAIKRMKEERRRSGEK